MRRAPKLAPLITAIGVSIILQNLAMLIWGRNYHAFPPIFLEHRIKRHVDAAAGRHHRHRRLDDDRPDVTFIQRTRLGRAMRATSENPSIAQLMGVNINQDHLFTFTGRIGAGRRGRADGQRQLLDRALLHGRSV